MATGQGASIARSEFATRAEYFFVCLLVSTEEIPEYLFAIHCPLPVIFPLCGARRIPNSTKRTSSCSDWTGYFCA